ncbi:MAG: DNA polymerase bacteriophage-type [Parcubacteria bacterium C7867-005]|nr:MAG: DNA polymerase bacteriophage-type [Parcubacteria bacterium C7867-005]
MDRDESLEKIKQEVLDLKSSPLYEDRVANRAFPVIGEGSHEAEMMFIGEAPGENEAKAGRPFCGRSGKLLDELFLSVQIKRESVYVTNIVKDRPPKNRDPKPEEIELYAPFLDRQIEIIKPKIIATLGRFSMDYIMNRYGLSAQIGPIGRLHGQVFLTTISGQNVKVVPLYHPAVALYNPNNKQELLRDFQILKTLI